MQVEQKNIKSTKLKSYKTFYTTPAQKQNRNINYVKKRFKSTALFTLDQAEYGTTQSLKLNNQTLPTIKHTKILEITTDQNKHFHNIYINLTNIDTKQTFSKFNFN